MLLTCYLYPGLDHFLFCSVSLLGRHCSLDHDDGHGPGLMSVVRTNYDLQIYNSILSKQTHASQDKELRYLSLLLHKYSSVDSLPDAEYNSSSVGSMMSTGVINNCLLRLS